MNTRAFPLLRILGCGMALAGAYLRAQDNAFAASRHEGVQALYPVMMKAVEAGDLEQARSLCEHAIRMEPRDAVHRYNLACIEARAGGPMLPRALAALEQAVQLGFNDRNSLQNDPDLAAIRGDPKFATILAKMGGETMAAKGTPTPQAPTLPGFEPPAARATTPVAPAPAAAPAKTATPKTAARAATAEEKPAAATYQDGVPVGLYFMTRYWFATRSLEKAAWYFAPDHTVYEHLETGFSKADLAAHRGRKGTARLAGDAIEITWADGKKTTSKLERDEKGPGFAWDMGIFTTVKPIESAAQIAGRYEGGESVTFSGSTSSVAKGLELRADGTFDWSSAAAIKSASNASTVTAGSSGGTKGTWRAENYSLILTDDTGKLIRGIAFPYDDEKTPITPDRLFFAGTMYKKRP